MAKRPQSALPFCCTIGMTVTTRLLFRPWQQVDRGAPTYLGLMVTAIQRSRSDTPSRCHSGAIQWFLSSPNIIWIPTIENKCNDPVISLQNQACREIMYIIHVCCCYPQPRIVKLLEHNSALWFTVPVFSPEFTGERSQIISHDHIPHMYYCKLSSISEPRQFLSSSTSSSC